MLARAVLTLTLLVVSPITLAGPPVFIIAGQSNCMGKFAPSNLSHSDYKDVPENLGGYYYQRKNDEGTFTDWMDQPNFGPEPLFIHKFEQVYPDQDFYVVKYCEGGSALLQWLRGHTQGYYEKLMQTIEDAGLPSDAEIDTFFWIQGENESKDKSAAKEYDTHFRTLIAQLRSDIGDGLRIITALPSPKTDEHIYRQYVRQRQLWVTATDPHAAAVITHYLADRGDGVHYTAGAQEKLGKDLYFAWDNLVSH